MMACNNRSLSDDPATIGPWALRPTCAACPWSTSI